MSATGKAAVGGPTSLSFDRSALSKQLVWEALNSRIDEIDPATCEPGDEDAFFVADLGELYRQHMRWKLNLGRVKAHYAVKCNPDPAVLRVLATLGCGFDCASKAEIDTVLQLGVEPDRIIYAQPCKTASYVRHAASVGVRRMTFDNAEELHKIKRFHPEAELLLRISTDDSASLCQLSLKFGAALESVQGLLEVARELNLDVAGVAFHVGSGASDPNAFLGAVRDARSVFDTAAALGFNMRTLDVGGGFVSETFEPMAAVLSRALREHFPPHVRVIGEPGRFYVSSAFTIACHVIARRTVEDPRTGERSYMLYLNDGVYGNFSSIMFDHQHPLPQVLRRGSGRIGAVGQQQQQQTRKLALPENTATTTKTTKEASSTAATLPPTPPESRPGTPGAGAGLGASVAGDQEQHVYSIWGPTCDGIDRISARSALPGPAPLDAGDWLLFADMGAYTRCSATRFNGFADRHRVVYVNAEAALAALMRW